MAGAFSSAFSSAFDIDTGGAVVEDRGDIGLGKGGKRKRYLEQRKRYYRQLQEELDRQLEARVEPEVAPARMTERRIVTEAIPPPVLADPPMIAGEATRLIREFLETHAAMKRATMDRELRRMAEAMARQQDEEDALMALMVILD